MDDGSWLSWIFLILFFLLAAYFSAAEAAFTAVSRSRLKALAERGGRRAEQALYILENSERAAMTTLLAQGIAHVAIGAIAALWILRRWSAPAAALGIVLVTLLLFFAAGAFPKCIGKKYAVRFSLSAAGSLRFFMRLLTPLSFVCGAVADGVARLTRGDAEVSVTEDELYDIIETMKDDGELDAEKGDLVHSALMFADVTAQSVLTARVDIAAIDVELTPQEILERIKEEKHSRLPVYRDSIDNIIGILQIRKYIKAYLQAGGAVELEPLLDEAYFVQQNMNIDEILPEMSRKKLNMAIVTDNYGGTLGILTVEDILEELVGEIWDEDDEVVETFSLLPDGGYLLDASLDMEEVFTLLGYEDPEDTDWEHKLLGEWVYAAFDHIPQEGDSFTYHALKITVAEMRQHRIIRLRADILPEEAAEGGDEA